MLRLPLTIIRHGAIARTPCTLLVYPVDRGPAATLCVLLCLRRAGLPAALARHLVQRYCPRPATRGARLVFLWRGRCALDRTLGAPADYTCRVSWNRSGEGSRTDVAFDMTFAGQPGTLYLRLPARAMLTQLTDALAARGV